MIWRLSISEVLVRDKLFCQCHTISFIFLKAGANGQEDKYFLPRFFKVEWQHARSICQSYGMEILTLESVTEQNYLLNLLKQHSALFGVHEWINIGAMTTTCASRDLWYWVVTGSKVSSPIKWATDVPNCVNDNKMCMALGKFEDENFYFVDIWCSGQSHKFLCKQKYIVFRG